MRGEKVTEWMIPHMREWGVINRRARAIVSPALDVAFQRCSAIDEFAERCIQREGHYTTHLADYDDWAHIWGYRAAKRTPDGTLMYPGEPISFYYEKDQDIGDWMQQSTDDHYLEAMALKLTHQPSPFDPEIMTVMTNKPRSEHTM